MFDTKAPKSRVDMTLNDDLVRLARSLTPNLSETVERLLADFVRNATMQHDERERLNDGHIEASNAFVAEHGSLAEEFPRL